DFRVPVVLFERRVVGEGRLDRSALARALGLPDVSITLCGVEAAETVHRLTQAAFAHYSQLVPPSGVARETLESVAADLAAQGGGLYRRLGDRVLARYAHPGRQEPTWASMEKRL